MFTPFPGPNNRPEPSASQHALACITTFIGSPALILCALFGIWFAENTINYAHLAKQAPHISADTLPQSAQQASLVAITGTLVPEGLLGDKKHLIPGAYLRYTRTIELYAWEEGYKQHQTLDANGKKATKPTLTYYPTWTSSPTPTEKFKEPRGHTNPEIFFAPKIRTVASFNVGNYRVITDHLRLPESSHLILSPDIVRAAAPDILTEHAIYKPIHPLTTPTSPLIGDTRITYSVVSSQPRIITIFGKLHGTTLKAATLRAGGTTATFQRLFWGTPDDALATLTAEETSRTWVWYSATFFMLFFGLLVLLRPVPTQWGIFPVFEKPSHTLMLGISGIYFAEAALLFRYLPNIASSIALLGFMLGAIISWLRTTNNTRQV